MYPPYHVRGGGGGVLETDKPQALKISAILMSASLKCGLTFYGWLILKLILPGC